MFKNGTGSTTTDALASPVFTTSLQSGALVAQSIIQLAVTVPLSSSNNAEPIGGRPPARRAQADVHRPRAFAEL